jgi:hypothetical protein
MDVQALEPWEAYPSIWKSKAAFFAYLRGSLRRIWARYPAKLKWKTAQLQAPPPGYPGRAKKVGKCYYCGTLFAASSLEVDHVAQAGACNDWGSAQEFLHNLLDCNGNWVLACKPCHKIKSYAERTGVPFEEAIIEKKVIEWLKKGKQEVVDLCKKYGYSDDSLSNESKRREALTAIFKEHGVG